MANKDVILLTGGNGFVGYATLIRALQDGFAVRAVVRRQKAIEDILKGPSASAFHAAGTLSFAIEPDLAQPDALVEHARGCTYLVHLAHPLGTVPGDFTAFAVGSNNAILRAAEANPSIKRVIWTSSVWGIVPYERILANHEDNVKIASGRASEVATLDSDSFITLPTPVAIDAPGIQRYNYAKALGAQLLRDYAAKNPSAHFDIVVIIPGWTLGPSELETTQKQVFGYSNTNSLFMFLYDRYTLAPGLGLPFEEDTGMLSGTVHIDDAAEAHVAATMVDLKSAKLRSYLLCSDGEEGPVFDDAIQVVKDNFPDEYRKMNPKAHHETIKLKLDASRTEKELLGRSFKTYKEMVYDTIGWLKDLPAS